MDSTDYYQLLKDPRWQKKRLEVLQTHGFKCDECGSTTDELQVHHGYYEKDKSPWEYPDDCFKVFCKEHHELWHTFKKCVDHQLAKMSVGDLEDLHLFLGYFAFDFIGELRNIPLPVKKNGEKT